MLEGPYRDLFAAIADSAGALTGLLFVARTLRGGGTTMSRPDVGQEVRAAAALLSFVNALTVSLFSLVPGTHVGYPALVVGILGVAFSAGGVRSILASPSMRHRRRRHLVLTVCLGLTFGLEIIGGVDLLNHPRDTNLLDLISYLLIVSLLIGVARSWELVGGRDTGIIASLAVLIGRHPGAPEPATFTPDGDAESEEARR